MSTPLSTSTGPKLLRTFFSSMIGVSTPTPCQLSPGGDTGGETVCHCARAVAVRRLCARPPPSTKAKTPAVLAEAGLLAKGGDLSRADLRGLGVAVVEDLLH